MSKSMFRVPFNAKLLVQLAMLVALEIVLNRFLSIRTSFVKIGFSFVPIVVCAIANGPVWATVVYVVADLTGTLIEGNIPLPGLTVGCAIIGFMYGLFLFELDRLTVGSIKMWLRVVLVAAINQFGVSLMFNTYWLWKAGFVGGGNPYFTSVLLRVPQTLILLAVQIVLIPALYQIVKVLRKQRLITPFSIKPRAEVMSK
jgi:Protein of unknown function (DUF1393).